MTRPNEPNDMAYVFSITSAHNSKWSSVSATKHQTLLAELL